MEWGFWRFVFFEALKGIFCLLLMAITGLVFYYLSVKLGILIIWFFTAIFGVVGSIGLLFSALIVALLVTIFLFAKSAFKYLIDKYENQKTLK